MQSNRIVKACDGGLVLLAIRIAYLRLQNAAVRLAYHILLLIGQS